MAKNDFINALKIAVEKGDFTSNQKNDISEKLSGYEDINFVLRDHSGNVISKIFYGKLENRDRQDGNVSSNQTEAIKWAISMGYSVPSKWNSCLTTFLVIVGICAYVIPGFILLLVVWNNGREYERDMKALVEKWVDAGKPKPGMKSRHVERLENIEDNKTSSTSTESRLQELLSMKEKRLISQEEYETLRKKNLGL
tara:strand:+ start:172 stop:762 length:591 start_codon:yes stop_codon:yes gene_type:complete